MRYYMEFTSFSNYLDGDPDAFFKYVNHIMSQLPEETLESLKVDPNQYLEVPDGPEHMKFISKSYSPLLTPRKLSLEEIQKIYLDLSYKRYELINKYASNYRIYLVEKYARNPNFLRVHRMARTFYFDEDAVIRACGPIRRFYHYRSSLPYMTDDQLDEWIREVHRQTVIDVFPTKHQEYFKMYNEFGRGRLRYLFKE